MREPKHRLPNRLTASVHRQRGAAAVITAVAIIALVAFLALAVDVGQLYYAQRDLEKQATLAALSGAQVGSGCRGSTAGVPGSLTQVQDVVSTSITNNPSVIPGAGDVRTGINGHPYAELGWVNSTSGQQLRREDGTLIYTAPADGRRHFFPLDSTDPNVSPMINSVRVNLSRPQPTMLIPFIGGGGGGTPMLYASATAQQQALGSFYLGTTLLDVNTASSPLLNPLLQGLLCRPGDTSCKAGIHLTAASYSGLLSTNVTLGQLATAVGVSSQDLSNLLSVNTTLPGVLNGLSPVLAATGTATSQTVAGLLTGLAAASTNPNSVPLGNILGAVDGVAANVPFVNLLDLIMALGEAATASNTGGITPIALPVSINVPSLISVSAFLKVGAPPKFSGLAPAGVATASTAEITLLVRIEAGAILNAVSSVLNGVINGVLGAVGGILGINISIIVIPPPLNIGVDVAIASAEAKLDALECPNGNANPPTAAPTAKLSATSSIATVDVGTFSGSASSAPALSPTTSLPLATVNIDASNVCVGVNLLGFCLGLPVDLGTGNLALSLGLSSVGVGGGTNAPLADINQFYPPVGDPPTYIARGLPPDVPIPGENPQIVGTSAEVSLNLDLIHKTGGTKLIGALTGILDSLFSAVLSLLQGLLDFVNTLVVNLIDPLLQALGIQLGSATVTMDAVQVGAPVIVTHELPPPLGS